MAIDNPYEILSQSFNFPTKDQRQWWHYTAPGFVKSMTDAKYTPDAKYKQLAFFYHCVLPHLGQFPYSYKPISPQASTMADLFNIEKMWPVVDEIARFDLSIDTTLFHKIADLLLLKDEAKALSSQPGFKLGGPTHRQYQFAVNIKDERLMLKGYFFTAMKSLAMGVSADRLISNMMESYVQSCAVSTFITVYLGCDMIDPALTRLKVYGLDSEVTFEWLVDLWTLGGRIPNEIKVDHMELGDLSKSLLPVIVNYTLLPNKPHPEPQMYLVPFGSPDVQIVDALTQFFERMGWGEAARTYRENLFSYYPNQDFSKTRHVQEAISLSYKEGKPYLSVYLSHF
ncbi:tryptophan dimethylallyltransferase-domain-containing protein [Talaromyces proteolyticus]|uniref:Tryptophan dimethylallyltransferase-domain-containing protein n=1 Tax=Talaromyces proteolyticus TaxID=1131652 RepID=A0AAD4PWZ3_9EURO|nr:tryptophan dimethylallyltransferase-domain-containing protein [Talaromyces proteolyticus]KAH8692972.1 tryptophan dimethylallyltransferase-domain-containing protein [Talaromyces proteolyticus]